MEVAAKHLTSETGKRRSFVIAVDVDSGAPYSAIGALQVGDEVHRTSELIDPIAPRER